MSLFHRVTREASDLVFMVTRQILIECPLDDMFGGCLSIEFALFGVDTIRRAIESRSIWRVGPVAPLESNSTLLSSVKIAESAGRLETGVSTILLKKLKVDFTIIQNIY